MMKNSKYFLLAALGLMAAPALAQETYQDTKFAENSLNGTARYVGMGGAMEPSLDFGADGQDSSPASPSLFDQPQMHGVKRTPKNIANAAVKIVDKPQRRITEIRIFYDDQTWETFVPKK